MLLSAAEAAPVTTVIPLDEAVGARSAACHRSGYPPRPPTPRPVVLPAAPLSSWTPGGEIKPATRRGAAAGARCSPRAKRGLPSSSSLTRPSASSLGSLSFQSIYILARLSLLPFEPSGDCVKVSNSSLEDACEPAQPFVIPKFYPELLLAFIKALLTGPRRARHHPQPDAAATFFLLSPVCDYIFSGPEVEREGGLVFIKLLSSPWNRGRFESLGHCRSEVQHKRTIQREKQQMAKRMEPKAQRSILRPMKSELIKEM